VEKPLEIQCGHRIIAKEPEAILYKCCRADCKCTCKYVQQSKIYGISFQSHVNWLYEDKRNKKKCHFWAAVYSLMEDHIFHMFILTTTFFRQQLNIRKIFYY
jgi:hypothetical protein